MGNEYDNVQRPKTLSKIKDSPYVLVVIISLLSGGGITTGINGLSTYRPYTTEDGAREVQARKDADTNERRARQEADVRIFTELHALQLQIDACEEYRNDHRVESAKTGSRLDQLERAVTGASEMRR